MSEPGKPSQTNEPSAASRRHFLKLAASGAAAAMMGSMATARAAIAEAAEQTPAARRSPELEAEIEKQKGSVAKTLETIRAYPLPSGSEPAFVFVPLRPGNAGDAERSR